MAPVRAEIAAEPKPLAAQPALFRNTDELPFELKALRSHVDPIVLRWAARRALAVGLGGDEVLRQNRLTDPDTMLKALATSLDLEVDLLDDAAHPAIDFERALKTKQIRRQSEADEPKLTMALTGADIRAVANGFKQRPDLAERVRLTSPERLNAFIRRVCADALAERAVSGMIQKTPHFSAGAKGHARFLLALVLLGVIAAYSLWLFPVATTLFIELALAATFLSWTALRIHACFVTPLLSQTELIPESELPVYSILAPLYREANVIDDFLKAISSIDYPKEKLDVKFIVEPDDPETLEKLRHKLLPAYFEIIDAPLRKPKTKPKALQAALPFARGKYVVVFDAEDRPEPGQLRAAYAAFRKGSEKLACVQAKLAIDNQKPGFVARHFAVEYSGLFDVLLPALAKLQLPLPLGGTSNHFNTEMLRDAGGWDPHNVTEDADLGIRLARLGYLTDIVDSTTFEEAPVSFGQWRRQRTRWFKGWMQTYIVHMRSPAKLFRQLGAGGFSVFQLLIGGAVLSALVHPFFLLALVNDSVAGNLLAPSQDITDWLDKALVFITLFSGYIGSAALAYAGMKRRKPVATGLFLFTIPVYWMMLSLAAWCAVLELIFRPHYWQKTEHGLAQRAASTPR